jgi:hypothetical protein
MQRAHETRAMRIPGTRDEGLGGRGHLVESDDGLALVFERLRQVAVHVVEGVPGARFRIDPFDAAVRLRPEADWVPEVELTLVVETNDAANGADSRRELLDRIASGLERFGIHRRQ